jgi:dynein regulatory complex protein 1
LTQKESLIKLFLEHLKNKDDEYVNSLKK